MADDFVTLRLPAGASDGAISYGTDQFFPYRADHTDPASGWHVDMPRRVSGAFLRQGGFTMVAPAVQVPHGLVLVRHRSDPRAEAHSAGHSVGDDGCVMVPLETSHALVESHGFEVVEAPAAKHKKASSSEAHIAALEAQLADLQALIAAMSGPAPASEKTGAQEKGGVAALSPEARAEIKEAKAAEKAEKKS